MKLYLVAGEASGDGHGAELMKALLEVMPDVKFYGAGGPKMAKLAQESFCEWTEHAVIGIVDVLRNYGYFRKQMDRMLDEVIKMAPEAVVFIDYPGFNLRLASGLRKRGYLGKLIFYISPQVWAWNRGRIPKMAKYLDLMLCIFPFEEALYEESGLKAKFVGHPLLDALPEKILPVDREKKRVGIFPGSRLREVRKNLPVMLETARELRKTDPELRFLVVGAREKLKAEMEAMLQEEDTGSVELVIGQSDEAMQRVWAAMLASGTATMEAAFFGMPFVLVYRVSWLTYWPAKWLIRVKWIGMVNILAGREIVKEFIQQEATVENLVPEMKTLLEDETKRAQVVHDLKQVIDGLGVGGASERAAQAIAEEVRGKAHGTNIGEVERGK